MTIPILTTKIYIPTPPSNLVPRPRLIDKLEGSFEKKLTLVSAPAGFGKTTLLSEYVKDCDHPVAWLSLDEEDSNPARFFVYIIIALQTIEPSIGIEILDRLALPQQAPIEAILTELINEISTTLGEFILVLDDYHRVESIEIDKALLFIIDHMPPQMRLVIACRTDPTLPFPRLRARGHLIEMRANDLRFTIEEVTTYLQTAAGLTISEENVISLESRTEGWITGLQLAALSMQALKDPRDIDIFVDNFSSSHRYILDYLTDEVLQQRPSGTRDFLLQTSILNRFSAPLCQAVTEMENSQEILETMDAANLFLIPLDDERYWYRYHHLFDDLLQKRLMRLQPEIVPELHLRAGKWYEQNGWLPDAFYHFIAGELYPNAAKLVEENARSLLERSELGTVMNWMDALPEEHVITRPWLCVFHAWALRLSGARFDAVEARLKDAESAIENIKSLDIRLPPKKRETEPKNEIKELNGHLLALRAFQHLYREDIPTVLEFTEQALEYKLEEVFVRSTIAFSRGWALRFSGDLETSYRTFNQGKLLSLASGNTYMAVAMACRSAYGRVLAGQLNQAMEEFQEAAQIAAGKSGKRFPVAGYAYVYMGGIYYEWNDLNAAERYLVEGIDLCARVGYIMDQVVGLVALAQVKEAQRERDAAQKAFKNAEKLRQKMSSYIYLRRWFEDIQIRRWHAQGAWDEIDRWIQICGLAVDDDLDYNRDMEHIILARALVYSGINQAKGAYVRDGLKLLGRLLEKAKSAKWMGKAIGILVLQSLAFQALGDQQAAFTTLGRVLNLAEPEGYIRTFIDEGERMYMLMMEFRAWVKEQPGGKVKSTGRYVDRLLEQFEQEKSGKKGQRTAEDITRMRQPITEPLSQRELEVLNLLANGATNQEIAMELVIALTTAKKHVSNILGKLEVTNRTQAVTRARELNLI